MHDTGTLSQTPPLQTPLLGFPSETAAIFPIVISLRRKGVYAEMCPPNCGTMKGPEPLSSPLEITHSTDHDKIRALEMTTEEK